MTKPGCPTYITGAWSRSRSAGNNPAVSAAFTTTAVSVPLCIVKVVEVVPSEYVTVDFEELS
jgi:hypothetical protein